MNKKYVAALLFSTLLFLLHFSVEAQTKKKKEKKGEFYFSWGYNAEWYTHSNVHVTQAALGNDYTFKNISGRDHIG